MLATDMGVMSIFVHAATVCYVTYAVCQAPIGRDHKMIMRWAFAIVAIAFAGGLTVHLMTQGLFRRTQSEYWFVFNSIAVMVLGLAFRMMTKPCKHERRTRAPKQGGLSGG